MRKLCIAIILVLTVCMPAAAVNSSKEDFSGDGAPVYEGFRQIASNDRMILFFHETDGHILLQDRISGAIWRSSPEGAEEDEIARGRDKTDLSSQLLVTYLSSRGDANQSNSQTGCVRRQTLKWEEEKDSVKVIYDFSRESECFTIPVRYSLGKDYLKAEILIKEITEKGESFISEFSLLPFFGAGGLKDEGYIMIPDGTGALMHFNSGAYSKEEFSLQVYGSDPVFSTPRRDTVKQDIRMPVFGIRKNGNALFAVIEEGASHAKIQAGKSGLRNSFNYVYTTFSLRYRTKYEPPGSSYDTSAIYIFNKKLPDMETFSVRYYPLSGASSGYVGMAQKYRQYLIETSALKKTAQDAKTPVFIDTYGAVKLKKLFLGIPYTGIQEMTTYSDLRNMIEALTKEGVKDIAVKYNAWMAGGLEDFTPDTVRLERKLGGKKNFNRLLEFIKANDRVTLFPDVDFLNYYRGSLKNIKYFSVSKNIARAPAALFSYKLSTRAKDTAQKPSYLLKPTLVASYADKFFTSACKNGIESLSLGPIGDMLYSDFQNNRQTFRSHTEEIWRSVIKQADMKMPGNIMVDGGNAYSLGAAGYISQAPTYSGRFDIEDEEVPFYQIVLRGYVQMCGEPVNLSDKPEISVLKAAETGTSLCFTLLGRNTELLKPTRFNYLFACNYREWIGSISDYWKKLETLYESAGACEIASHEKLCDGVYRTVFSNNTAVTVNYNDFDVNFGGIRTGARDFTVEGGK